jgi:EmrB/QacA subfamily drug resistance transporter
MATALPLDNAAATRAAFRLVFPGVMVAMFVASVDQTILATTLPAIGATFGDLADVSWVAIAYLLAATVTAPIHGYLGDRFGRRRMLTVALGVFVIASVGCALAPTLFALVVGRAAQGAGGGGLMTLSQALIGEHVPPRERARFQGYFAAMYALASTLGPVLGGVLTEHLTWRAVFWINLPLVAIATALAFRIPHVPPAPSRRFRFDFAGAALFGVSAVALLYALASGGHRLGWTSPTLLTLLGTAATGFIVLGWWERRVADPMIPVRLLSVPAILRSNVVVMCFAACVFSAVLYLPLYLQLGRGAGIGESGLWLLPISLSTAAGATVAGRLISRTGRLTAYAIAGLVVTSVAFATLAVALHVAPTPWVVVLMMVSTFGLGGVMPACQIIIQDTAGRGALGSATASISVSRSIGGATGVALVGALLFGLIGSYEGLLHGAGSAGAAVEQAAARGRLDTAFRIVFAALATIAAAAAAIAWTIPRRRV